MATSNVKTPGVYIQEISTLGSSVVPVGTAIPAFIGYTEKGAQNTPTCITSLIEYQQAFGGSFQEQYSISIDSAGIVTATPDSISGALSPYTLFYHMQMFFANGGGTCYIISVGNYDTEASLPIDRDALLDGVAKAEEVDEVTLLVVPEVLNMSGLTVDADIKSVYDAMLSQCNKLKDRFCVFDVKSTGDPSADALTFRNNNIGANYLNYGSAYYPPLNTVLTRTYSDDDVIISSDARATTFTYATEPNNRLSTVLGGIGRYMSITIDSSLPTPTTPAPSSTDTVTVSVSGITAIFTGGVDFPIATGGPNDNKEIAAALIDAINNHPTLSIVARAQLDSTTIANDKLYIVTRNGSIEAGDPDVTITSVNDDWTTQTSPAGGALNSQNTALYNSINAAIEGISSLTLPPAATICGIYTAVDNDRGVWKAPANVGITNIIGPEFMITDAQQSGLNVDATSGKSINAIRTFVGRGTIVWGARTLEGNSNEWRYIPVRRLFIMVEESAKKASEFVVFEANDKNTWNRVKAMIGNFLTDLWRQGALAGDKPDQAFFVQVGLGETMTAQDILEGKMIVTIGLAAVRPAEFIILQFMHKVQEA